MKYFKTTITTAKETNSKEANAAVSRLTNPQRENRKRKAYTAFSDKQRDAIDQYAAENKFKQRINFRMVQKFQNRIFNTRIN